MNGPAAPPMLGVAPPMAGPPSSIPGPLKTARDKLMQAGRLMFEAIEAAPHMAGDINEVIESLTKLLQQSAEAPGLPPDAPEGMVGPPPLDRTPAGPTGGSPMASPTGGGAHPAMILARLMGRG